MVLCRVAEVGEGSWLAKEGMVHLEGRWVGGVCGDVHGRSTHLPSQITVQHGLQWLGVCCQEPSPEPRTAAAAQPARPGFLQLL